MFINDFANNEQAEHDTLLLMAYIDHIFGVRSVRDTIMDCLPQDIDINNNIRIQEDAYDLDIPAKYNYYN